MAETLAVAALISKRRELARPARSEGSEGSCLRYRHSAQSLGGRRYRRFACSSQMRRVLGRAHCARSFGAAAHVGTKPIFWRVHTSAELELPILPKWQGGWS